MAISFHGGYHGRIVPAPSRIRQCRPYITVSNKYRTRSTGTVHTSAKARLISVAIRIRICDPDRHQNLIICSLTHCHLSLKISCECQPSLKISCKPVQKCELKVANRQTRTLILLCKPSNATLRLSFFYILAHSARLRFLTKTRYTNPLLLLLLLNRQDKQTDKQTDKQRRKHILVGEDSDERYPVDLRILVGGRVLSGDGLQLSLELRRVAEQADSGRQSVHDAVRCRRRQRRRLRTKVRVLRRRPDDSNTARHRITFDQLCVRQSFTSY